MPHVRICAGGGEQSSCLPRPTRKPPVVYDSIGRDQVSTALPQAEPLDQAVELVERVETDRHVALLAAFGAALDVDFDRRRQQVG